MQELAQQNARAAEARQRTSRDGWQEAGAGKETAAVHTASREDAEDAESDKEVSSHRLRHTCTPPRPRHASLLYHFNMRRCIHNTYALVYHAMCTVHVHVRVLISTTSEEDNRNHAGPSWSGPCGCRPGCLAFAAGLGTGRGQTHPPATASNIGCRGRMGL